MLPVSHPWHRKGGNVWTLETYLAGDVQLNGLDADVLGSLRHDVWLYVGCEECGYWEEDGRVLAIFLSNVSVRGWSLGEQ